jgi:phosphoglucomutase
VRNLSKGTCFGAIILTASHNPGGVDEDFGIKFNNAAGAPATENITGRIFENTKKIQNYRTLETEQSFSFQKDFTINVDGHGLVEVNIVSSTALYVDTMKNLFDFDKLQNLFSRNDFWFVFDGLHGASGPYAVEIFHKILGVKMENLLNCDNLPDFGGHHPDPNLVYAKALVEKMDYLKQRDPSLVPDFGAACDGDADRNMILGKQFFISPSDSIAMITSNFKSIKNLNRENGLVGVARSMPTSSALDRVAKKLGYKVYLYSILVL